MTMSPGRSTLALFLFAGLGVGCAAMDDSDRETTATEYSNATITSTRDGGGDVLLEVAISSR
jgi:hypothetical protein